MTSMPWLTILWAVPMVGAALVMLLPSGARHLAKYAALAVSLVVLAVTVLLAVRFQPAARGTSSSRTTTGSPRSAPGTSLASTASRWPWWC